MKYKNIENYIRHTGCDLITSMDFDEVATQFPQLVKDAEIKADAFLPALIFSNYEARCMARDIFIKGYLAHFIETGELV